MKTVCYCQTLHHNPVCGYMCGSVLYPFNEDHQTGKLHCDCKMYVSQVRDFSDDGMSDNNRQFSFLLVELYYSHMPGLCTWDQ